MRKAKLSDEEKKALLAEAVKNVTPMKSWWCGDDRVTPFMGKVRKAIERNIPGGNIDIYNRAYEAVYEAIVHYDKNKKAGYRARDAEVAELKAKLWVAKDSQLRTYDGLTDKADKYDDLLAKAEKLVEALEKYESIPIPNAILSGRGPYVAREALSTWRTP